MRNRAFEATMHAHASSPEPIILALRLLTLLAAAAGHVALSVAVVNVAYGQPWPRWMQRLVRAAHDAWLLLGTPWLTWLLVRSNVLAGEPWLLLPEPLLAYLTVCLVAALLILPAVTLVRWLRPPPPELVANHSHVVDIAAKLGRRPVCSSGRHQLMARLPINEQYSLEVAERTICMGQVPQAWDGLTILHISDLHFAGTVAEPYFHSVVAELTGRHCDLIALTGDIVDGKQFYDWIVPVLSPLRASEGKFAILGNHDSWYEVRRIRSELARSGFELLSGRCIERPLRGHRLVLAGFEEPWLEPMPQWTAEPDGQQRRAFRLLLSHSPDSVYAAARLGVDLMLAGHSHGGQVRLPLVGPVYLPSRYGRRFDAGLFRIGHTLLHVTRGISGKHPLRVRCRPEAVYLTLKHAN